MRWLAVRGASCDHGNTIPMPGVSRNDARPWYGLFCPAGICKPSRRWPDDPWLADPREVSSEEARYRMNTVRRALAHGYPAGRL